MRQIYTDPIFELGESFLCSMRRSSHAVRYTLIPLWDYGSHFYAQCGGQVMLQIYTDPIFELGESFLCSMRRSSHAVRNNTDSIMGLWESFLCLMRRSSHTVR